MRYEYPRNTEASVLTESRVTLPQKMEWTAIQKDGFLNIHRRINNSLYFQWWLLVLSKLICYKNITICNSFETWNTEFLKNWQGKKTYEIQRPRLEYVSLNKRHAYHYQRILANTQIVFSILLNLAKNTIGWDWEPRDFISKGTEVWNTSEC